MVNVSLVREQKQFKRRMRRPSHSFQLRTVPFAIQPFLLAPVLPGETLKNLLLQSRVVSDPVKSPLVGWWNEYYLFYVKHRDLVDYSDELQSMVLSPDWTSTGTSVHTTASDVATYFAGEGINYAQMCLERVTQKWFRDEGETWNSAVSGETGLPLAQLNGNSFTDSVMLGQFFEAPGGEDVDLNADGTITTGEVDEAMRQYELAKMMGLADMSYEDFLSTYGIPAQRVEEHIPELLRYVREWQYPSNTVDPADGSVASAVSWSIAERADKDRFFSEPGFVFGVTVSRPKVYLDAQSGSAAWYLRDAFSWLPAVMSDDPYTSVRRQDFGTGPLDGVGAGQLPGPADDDYMVDTKDLFVHGDQFVVGSPGNLVTLPAADGQRRYPSDTDVNNLFVDSAGTARRVRMDGVCNLTIAGRLEDTSTRTPNV